MQRWNSFVLILFLFWTVPLVSAQQAASDLQKRAVPQTQQDKERAISEVEQWAQTVLGDPDKFKQWVQTLMENHDEFKQWVQTLMENPDNVKLWTIELQRTQALGTLFEKVKSD